MTPIFYIIFVLLCVLHVILENKKKSFVQLMYIIFSLSVHTSEKYIFEKMEMTRLSRFAKVPYFLIYDNKIRICIEVLVKKFINGCRSNFDCFSDS